MTSLNNNKFGCYLPVKIDRYGSWVDGNKDMFLFSLKSNGRIGKMMKFEWKQGYGYYLDQQSSSGLICLGYGIAIRLYKENSKTASYCYQNNDYFDYHGIQNALCGCNHPQTFTPKRITVIQMI